MNTILGEKLQSLAVQVTLNEDYHWVIYFPFNKISPYPGPVKKNREM